MVEASRYKKQELHHALDHDLWMPEAVQAPLQALVRSPLYYSGYLLSLEVQCMLLGYYRSYRQLCLALQRRGSCARQRVSLNHRAHSNSSSGLI